MIFFLYRNEQFSVQALVAIECADSNELDKNTILSFIGRIIWGCIHTEDIIPNVQHSLKYISSKFLVIFKTCIFVVVV